MSEQPRLIDVTEMALQAGLPIHWSETGVANWLKSGPSTGAKSIAVFFTEMLSERLRSTNLGETGFSENSLVVLGQAKIAIIERIIGQHAWRTRMEVTVRDEILQLWLIVNHSQSDGIAIGFGPGDFW